MRYLLIISTVCFLLSFTASARDWDYKSSQDQLRAVAWGAGTYVLAKSMERNFDLTHGQALLASGILAGSAAYIINHYEDTKNQGYKTQGAAIGVGIAWTLGFGLGL